MDHTGETPSSADRRAAWIAGSALALLAVFYLWRGMPWPHQDDYAWIGTGIELARTGQLTNHAMEGWLAGFGTDKFYVQPPLAAYMLALWVLLFNASNASFIVYAWLWYVVGGIGLAQVLRRFGLPLAMRLLLLIVYLNVLVTYGLRPEPEMFGLVFAGLALLDTAAPFRRKLSALTLLGFSVLTYPLAVALAVPFTVALLWPQAAGDAAAAPGWRATFRAWLPPALLAGVIVLTLFLAMIHFELRTFWTVLHAHRLSRAVAGGALREYVRFITQYQEALFTLPKNLLLVAAAGYVAVHWRHVEPRLRLWVGASVATAVLCVYLYVVRALDVIALVAFAAACLIAVQPRFRPYRWRIVLCLGGFYLWTEALWFVNAALRRMPDPARLDSVREAALHSGQRLVINSSTARYVFHYDLPEGTLHAEYIAPDDNAGRAKVRESRARDYWVVTAQDKEALHSPTSDYHSPYISIGHHEFHSAPLCPDEPLVIRPSQ